MKGIDRNLIAGIKSVFTKEFLNGTAKEIKFLQRKSSLTPESFISLCAFSGNSLSEDSLSKLSSFLASEENIKISPQALNERFNKYSVEFLTRVLKEILIASPIGLQPSRTRSPGRLCENSFGMQELEI